MIGRYLFRHVPLWFFAIWIYSKNQKISEVGLSITTANDEIEKYLNHMLRLLRKG